MFDIVREKLDESKRLVIAIDGPSGSGKTTLANKLQNQFPTCSIYRMDDFFVPMNERTKERLNGVFMHVDYQRLINEVLQNDHDEIIYQKFNCKTQSFESFKELRSNLIVIEGVSSARIELREYIDYVIYLDVDRDTQLSRIQNRETNEMYQRFINEWIPLEDEYFRKHKPIEIADITLRM